jgi:hypothetical protein
MAETDGAWWAEVAHLREDIERRRAEQAELARSQSAEGRHRPRFQREAETSGRRLVDAELAELASAAPSRRHEPEHEAGEATQRTGRFDREGGASMTTTAPRDEPRSEPISPAALLSLDVNWQEPVRKQPTGEFTELIIPGQGVPGRPTVQIRGHGAEARFEALLQERARRRPPRTVSERLGPRPDRVALWALLLAVVLVITAVATADASTLGY